MLKTQSQVERAAIFLWKYSWTRWNRWKRRRRKEKLIIFKTFHSARIKESRRTFSHSAHQTVKLARKTKTYSHYREIWQSYGRKLASKFYFALYLYSALCCICYVIRVQMCGVFFRVLLPGRGKSLPRIAFCSTYLSRILSFDKNALFARMYVASSLEREKSYFSCATIENCFSNAEINFRNRYSYRLYFQ